MTWTAATRGDYVRVSGAYASDVTDREWALIALHPPAARPGGRPRSACLRRVVNAVFYLLQTGCQWRMLPREFPPRSTVYGYFPAWIAAGVWAHLPTGAACSGLAICSTSASSSSPPASGGGGSDHHAHVLRCSLKRA